ncbi:MAG: hypothetical protein KUF79_17260 [Candidatus Thiodiazotropha sp. (ex Ctena orbiculata)]|nr:hypothetical protein [Candidatus Thiodiazotropha taylori]
MKICLIGSESDRERFAYEAQTRHGFSVFYNLDEYEQAAQRDGRFMYLGCTDTDSIDMKRVRAVGTVVFVTNDKGCTIGDFVFRHRAYRSPYAVALNSLMMAIDDEEIHTAAQT